MEVKGSKKQVTRSTMAQIAHDRVLRKQATHEIRQFEKMWLQLYHGLWHAAAGRVCLCGRFRAWGKGSTRIYIFKNVPFASFVFV